MHEGYVIISRDGRGACYSPTGTPEGVVIFDSRKDAGAVLASEIDCMPSKELPLRISSITTASTRARISPAVLDAYEHPGRLFQSTDELSDGELRLAIEGLTLLSAGLARDGRDCTDADDLRHKLVKARAIRRTLA